MQIQTGIDKTYLEAAQMATFLRIPETETARQFVRALTEETLKQESITQPRKRRRRKDDMERFEQAVGAFSADAIFHNSREESDGFLYRSSDREALSETLVSSRHFDQLIKLWGAMGLIETTGYFQARTEFEGPTDHVFMRRARRIRATPELMQMAEKFDISPENVSEHFPKQNHLVSLVTIRADTKRKNGVNTKAGNVKIRGSEYDAQVAIMKELNATYRKHSFSLSDTPQLYRLFNRGDFANFDFNMGGRLYCASDDNWQSKSTQERALIRIDGEPTVEVDVRASHLAILYGLTGQRLDTIADPYHIHGIERDVVKMVFTAWCGLGKRPVRWPKEQAARYAQRHGRKPRDVYKLKNVVQALQDRHPVMAKVKYPSLDWSKLQWIESDCFVSAMLELSRRFEVPALPVHDSLIVRERDADLVKDVLGSSYQRRIGFKPVIRET